MKNLADAIIAGCQILARDKLGEYVCFPITTGKRLWDLAERLGVSDFEAVKGRVSTKYRYRTEVVEPNLRAGRKLVFQIGRRYPFIPVYDPSQLWITQWSQTNYYSFWEHLIRERIRRIHLCEGWQYSQGCVLECVHSFEIGKKVWNFEGRRITPAQCKRLIETTLREGVDKRFDVGFLEIASKRFTKLIKYEK